MGWMHSMKRSLNEKGIFVEQGKMIVQDRCVSD